MEQATIRASEARAPFTLSTASDEDRKEFSYKVVADGINFRQDFKDLNEADETAAKLGKLTKAHVIKRHSAEFFMYQAGNVIASYEPKDNA